MALYKICPNCGKRNEPNYLECEECEFDLSSVIATDPDAEITDGNNNPQDEAPQEDTSSQMFKICTNCGKQNPVQARKCVCGEELIDVEPVTVGETVECHFQLAAVGENYVYSIPCGVSLIGRDCEMRDYLSGKQYVSRIHAKIVAEDGKLFIENLSKTNYTYVNNIRIPGGKVQLQNGDEIGLGGILVNGKRQNGAAYLLVGVMV